MDVLTTTFRGLLLVVKKLILFAFPFHAAAWRASAESIRTLLNASDTEKDDLTKLWRDYMQSQLTAVAITVCSSYCDLLFARCHRRLHPRWLIDQVPLRLECATKPVEHRYRDCLVGP